MGFTNEALAGAFAEIAGLLHLAGEDRFRVRAYERAADAIRTAPVDLGTVAPADLTGIKGIGASTAKKVREFLDSGRIGMLEDLRARFPDGVLELVRVPGLGPKTAMQLYAELGVDSVEALREAIAGERLRELKGLGPKTEANLREALSRLGAKQDDRVPAADVLPIAEEFTRLLAAVPEALDVACAGSLRRMRETIGDVDILVASEAPDAVMAAFRASRLVTESLAAGQKKSSVLVFAPRGGVRVQVDLRVVEPEAWGAALVYFTGSKAHNVRIRERAVRRGLLLNEYGLYERDSERRLASRTEEDVYRALGLPWIPPPLREDAGEVEAADAGTLPRVVTVDDLQGELHGHTDWSGDGKVSLDGMVAAAAARGYAYWAVTDHAENLRINGIDRDGMRARRRAIAELQERHGMRILDAVELNIGIDGSVDYDPDFLAEFDVCTASVHSLMRRPEPEQTARLLTAMRNPNIHVIGHPTGRKLGIRPGYEINVDAVLEAAVATGTALEVNASPRRLDLSGDLVRRAVQAGAPLAISSDAHSLRDLDNIGYGVATAQRGWATPADVLNCRDLEDLLAFVAGKRGS